MILVPTVSTCCARQCPIPRLDPWETEQSGWKETVNALRHIQETVDSKSREHACTHDIHTVYTSSGFALQGVIQDFRLGRETATREL